MLDSSKPTTLSAGMGAFVAVAGVSVLIVIGTVICVIRYRRRARLRGLETAEVNKSEIGLIKLRHNFVLVLKIKI